MRRSNFRRLLFFACLVSCSLSQAQIDTSFARKSITYPEYLSKVGKQNLGYAAQRFNLNIVEAGILVAKIFPDPTISLIGFNNGEQRMKLGYGAGTFMGYLVELGGKRKARINLATSQTDLTKALLEDYFRNLRADATLSFLAGLRQKLLLSVLLNSYVSMQKLARSDSLRFRLGSITEIDAKQSQLEAGTMLNQVFQGESDLRAALLQLGMMLGEQNPDSVMYPIGDFSKFDRDFDLKLLITEAQNNRADLLAALRNKTVSQDALKLVKANRTIDLGVNLGVTSTSYVLNIIAPTPSFSVVSAGVSVPLKFANKYKGDLKQAEYGIQQADVLYKQTELQVETQVTQAHYNYLAAKKQVQQFNAGLLIQAKRVYDGKVYSYTRGETSLLEVLNARRTYNETQLNYFMALYNYAAGLVELERMAGIWDINF
jgi:cobalt-zinc-cadmium efflux system outer membrane protein